MSHSVGLIFVADIFCWVRDKSVEEVCYSPRLSTDSFEWHHISYALNSHAIKSLHTQLFEVIWYAQEKYRNYQAFLNYFEIVFLLLLE